MLTTRFVTGAPNWLDLGTPDLDGALSFYDGLFGWQFRSAGPAAGGYGFFQLSGASVAGALQTTPEQGPPSWNVYFQSPDADATAKAVEHARGTVLVPPMDVMGQGRLATFADRAGAPFGTWQPGRTKGLEVAGDLASLCWLELYTPDLPAAAAFYHQVFGWETEGVPFPGGTYTCVHPAEGGADAVFGGIVPPADDPAEADAGADPGAGAYWLPYFAVADTDAVVTEARDQGGTVTMSATDVAGVGRIARLTDPYGARFAVLEPAPRQG
jgi:predicted enzyme related to lactoylglutathione lyase